MLQLNRRTSRVLVVLAVFAFIFACLRQDALRSVLPERRVVEFKGNKDDGLYDPQAESGTQLRLAAKLKEMQYRPGKEAIYRSSLSDFDTSQEILDEIRQPAALKKTTMSQPFTDYIPYEYLPKYVVEDKESWTMTHEAEFNQCSTPWKAGGTPDKIRSFLGKAISFPEPVFGSQDAMGWEKYTCFERRGRWAPYGFTDADMESEVKPPIDWNSVNWGGLQDTCFKANRGRFELQDHGWGFRGKALGFLSQLDRAKHFIQGEDQQEGQAKRTAILVPVSYRTKYHDSDMHNMRAMINELSFYTGGQYQVYLLAEANPEDDNDEMWVDSNKYHEVVQKTVPSEFQGITHLYTERLIRTWYPKAPKTGFKGDFRSTFSHLALQRFAHLNPSYAYFWTLDINTRFTGHYYALVSSLPTFARRLPRKIIWEKSERLYIPSVHGPYETAFRDKVEEAVDLDASVWTAPEVPEFQQHGPRPPPELARDEHFKWGVGEEADLITLAPIFNPVQTSWEGRTEVWGYEFGRDLPRRVIWTSQAVHSKLLMDLMHHEALQGRFLNSRMAAPTIAMLHALKAVYAPHPVWMENDWQGSEADEMFNSGPAGVVGSSANSSYGGGERGSRLFWGESTFDRESKGARKLWDRFMGRGGWKAHEQKTGRPCLPPMLLYPIRDPTVDDQDRYDGREKVVWEY